VAEWRPGLKPAAAVDQFSTLSVDKPVGIAIISNRIPRMTADSPTLPKP
jgi:hypothetical protein